MKQVTISAERTIAAPPAATWEAVADVSAYAQAASSLSRVEVSGGGQSWDERCTLWEEGRRYRMEVDTTSYPAPLRQLLRSFSGTWSVEPTAERSRVVVAFDAVPRLGPLGRTVRLMGRRARSELEGILDTYERAATRRASARAA